MFEAAPPSSLPAPPPPPPPPPGGAQRGAGLARTSALNRKLRVPAADQATVSSSSSALPAASGAPPIPPEPQKPQADAVASSASPVDASVTSGAEKRNGPPSGSSTPPPPPPPLSALSSPPPSHVAATSSSKTADGDAQEQHPAAPAEPQSRTTEIKGSDVVAPGSSPRVLQLPSPVYCAEWISETHVVIGAGGGGRRFGMANLIVVLAITTSADDSAVKLTAEQHSAVCTERKESSQRRPDETPAMPAADQLWRFVTAMDLEGDIPWCATRFVRRVGPHSLHENSPGSNNTPPDADDHICGYIAISSVTCFVLIGVEHVAEKGSYALRRLARVEVPHDLVNPDKKPIALTEDVLVVAHDDKGVLAYHMNTLLPGVDGPTQRATTIVAAQPIAEWRLPARVNDLHANHVNMVRTKVRRAAASPSPDCMPGSHGPSSSREVSAQRSVSHAGTSAAKTHCTALLLDFVVVAALVQDKTLRLGSFRLHRRATTGSARQGDAAPATAGEGCLSVVDNAVLKEEVLKLPFTLMRSSMRLVRLFALQNVTSHATRAEARRLLTMRSVQAHQAHPGGSAPPETVARLLLVVFDITGNQSYALQARITASLGAAASPSPSSTAAAPRGAHRRSRESLLLQVTLEGTPSAILKDAITSLSACQDTTACSDHAAAGSCFGAELPQRWLAGTVEGWVASVRLKRTAASREHVYVLESTRPASSKAAAKRYPALHKEPISCVAVSSRNDVITADISQHVVISALPFFMPSRGGSPSSPVLVKKYTGLELFEDARGGTAAAGRLLAHVSKPQRFLFIFVSILALLLAVFLS